MILADSHVHSLFSTDSDEDMEAIIETCIGKGFRYVYFTDHHDEDFPFDNDRQTRDFQLDFDAYISTLTDLRERYSGRIEVRFGVEQGICPDTAHKISALSDSYPFDFIIGSSHLTSLDNGDPYYPSYYEGKTNIAAYREYFSSEADNVSLTDGYDVYGHLDYAVRYCPDKSFEFHFGDYRDIFEVIIKRLIEHGKGIEINTSGIAKIGYPHPHIEILKMYREMGGEIITIGSDAHVKENIGVGFNVAEDIMTSLGYRYYTVYKNRKPEFLPFS